MASTASWKGSDLQEASRSFHVPKPSPNSAGPRVVTAHGGLPYITSELSSFNSNIQSPDSAGCSRSLRQMGSGDRFGSLRGGDTMNIIQVRYVRNVFSAILLACFTLPAKATTTTYYWHQTSASEPGLLFTGQYTVVDGDPVPAASSTDSNPEFGGLINFFFQATDVQPVTLADLTPQCVTMSGACLYGYPSWYLPGAGALSFIDRFDGYQYDINAAYADPSPFGNVYAGADGPGPLCTRTGECYGSGYWSTESTVPEVPSLAIFGVGCVLLAAALGAFARSRAKPANLGSRG